MNGQQGMIGGGEQLIRLSGETVTYLVILTGIPIALPVDFAGVKAKMVLISGQINNVSLAFGGSTIDADVVTSLMVARTTGSGLVIDVRGYSHFSHIDLVGGGGDLKLTPVDYVRQLDAGALPVGSNAIVDATIDAASTTEIAIPNRADGSRARFVRITGDNQIVFKPGVTGDLITAHAAIRNKGTGAFNIDVSGYTHILAKSAAGPGRTICVTPLEL